MAHVTSIDLGPVHMSFDADDPSQIFTFAMLSVVVHSVLPLPVSSVVWIASVVLFGVVYGFAFALLTTTIGSYISLLLARSCRSLILPLLGKYEDTWHAMDRAIVLERWKIPLLVRATPVMPVVPANFMLALTSIDDFTYVWTVFVGVIPASIPYAYTAVVGEQVLTEFPPKDPVLLSVSLVGLLATMLAVYKIGTIATNELNKLGVGTQPAATDPDSTSAADYTDMADLPKKGTNRDMV